MSAGVRRHADEWARREGLPRPLGVVWLPAEQSYNFALYSKHAERVVLMAFRDENLTTPAFQHELEPLPRDPLHVH